MPVASRKVHAEYHDPVGICKVMDSCAGGCRHKLGCILTSNVKYSLGGNYPYQMDLPLYG